MAVKCKMCGRELKNPDSIHNRIGPVCMKKLLGYIPQIKAMKASEPKEDKADEPIEGQITLFDWRDKNAEYGTCTENR